MILIANPIMVKRLSKAASNNEIKRKMDAEDMIDRLINREAKEQLKEQAEMYEEKMKDQAVQFEKEKEVAIMQEKKEKEEIIKQMEILKQQLEELKK